MIKVRLQGRLGNQMFQYATGFALAKRRSTTLQVDLSAFFSIKSHKDFTLWQFPALGLNPLTPTSAIYKSATSRIIKIQDRKLVFKMNGLGFDKQVISLPNDTLLDGYFQSEKYFADHHQEIKQKFSLSQLLPVGSEITLSRIKHSSRLVALHIRRGDYIGNPMFDVDRHDYYRRAMDYLSMTQAVTYLVFSDQIDWCRKQDYLQSKTIFFSDEIGLKFKSHIQEMALMSACDDLIIAGSTFSWWAAWLNMNNDKRVIMPSQWLSSYTAAECGLSVPGWLEL